VQLFQFHPFISVCHKTHCICSSIAIEEKYQQSLSQIPVVLDDSFSDKSKYNYIDTTSQHAFVQLKAFGTHTRLVRTAYIEKMKTQVKGLTELRIQHEKLMRYHRRKMHDCNVEYAQCLLGELPRVSIYSSTIM
jgi:hypothetical protein